MRSGIIYSPDQDLIETFFDACSEVGVGLIKKDDFTNFIFDLQQDKHDLIVFDSDVAFESCLQHVKIIKKIKPKTPLMVISGVIEKIDGGKIYEEGIFHLAQKPVDKNNIKEIVAACVNTLKNRD